MQLNILGRTYRVGIAAKPITQDGEAKAGRCNHETKLIEISPDVLPDDRLDTLVHEAQHAFEEVLRLEPALGEEQRASRSVVGASVYRQIEAQGGTSALALLVSPGTFDRPGPAVGTSPGGVWLEPKTCHRCARPVLECNIVNGAVVEVREGPAVERWFECPICDTVHVWREWGETPSGQPVPGSVQFLIGREAAAWLRQQQPAGELRLVPCD